MNSIMTVITIYFKVLRRRPILWSSFVLFDIQKNSNYQRCKLECKMLEPIRVRKEEKEEKKRLDLSKERAKVKKSHGVSILECCQARHETSHSRRDELIKA